MSVLVGAMIQCDQIARLFFNIWPFTSRKICQKVYKICQSSFKFLPNRKIGQDFEDFAKVWSHWTHPALPQKMFNALLRSSPVFARITWHSLFKRRTGGGLASFSALLLWATQVEEIFCLRNLFLSEKSVYCDARGFKNILSDRSTMWSCNSNSSVCFPCSIFILIPASFRLFHVVSTQQNNFATNNPVAGFELTISCSWVSFYDL